MSDPVARSVQHTALRCTRRAFVGRAAELRDLRAEQRRSEQGQLRVALVLGDAGLGKTRLAAELLSGEDAPAHTLTARSSPLRRTPPFDRWAAELGRCITGQDAADGICPACGSGVDDPSALLRSPGIPSDAPIHSPCPHDHVIQQMAGLLARASADCPRAVVLDDVHWADEALWELLLLLSQDYSDARLFVLATARPGELQGHRVAARALLALEQELAIHRVHLPPFTRADVCQLAATAAQQDTAPPALVDWLVNHSQGNPRFAIGLLEALIDEGADLRTPALCGVPQGLARWIRAEAAQLDACAFTILELLAIADDPLDPDNLARIAGQLVEDTARALERLVRCGMVIERKHHQSLGYEITGPLVRQALYADISGARRRIWHQRTAETLLSSGTPAAAAPPSGQSEQAGDDDTVDGLIEAAGKAERHGSHDKAWSAIQTLLDLLPSGDERWLDVLDALLWQHDWIVAYRAERYATAGIAAMRRMEQLLAASDDLRRQANVKLRLAGFLIIGAGELRLGQHVGQHALALFQQAGCAHEARTAVAELAWTQGWAGDLLSQEELARQVLGEAESALDHQAATQAIRALGFARGMQGRFAEAEGMLVRGIELAQASGQTCWISWSLAQLAVLDACQGHMSQARSRWAQATAFSPPCPEVLVWICGAQLALLAGDLAAVEAYERRAAAQTPQGRSPLRGRVWAMAAMTAAEGGRITEARQRLDRARRVSSPSHGAGLFSQLCCWAESVVARAEGRLAAAVSLLQQAVERVSAMSAWAVAGLLVADLAEVAVAAGDPATAARAAIQAKDIARRTGVPSYQALGQFAAAWALLARDQHDEAARAAAGAVEGLRLAGYALMAARARVAYARAVRRCDPSAAVRALREAIAAFDASGATWRAEQARKLLAQLGSPEPPAADAADEPAAGAVDEPAAVAVEGPASLTDRERQVAELAACGHTARQIADRLYIGTRTVETHLAHIYPKLGIVSKYQLIHHADDLGLTPHP